MKANRRGFLGSLVAAVLGPQLVAKAAARSEDGGYFISQRFGELLEEGRRSQLEEIGRICRIPVGALGVVEFRSFLRADFPSSTLSVDVGSRLSGRPNWKLIGDQVRFIPRE